MPALIHGLLKAAPEKLIASVLNKSKADTKKIRVKLSRKIRWRISGQVS